MTQISGNASINTLTPDNAARMAGAVARWTGQLTRRLFVRQFLLLATGYLFLWGTAVLVLRVTTDVPRSQMALAGAGLLVLAAVAWWWARKQRPTTAAVRAMLDSHSRAGGLYMVEAEKAGWGEKLPAVQLPRVTLKVRRQGMLLAMAAAFVAITFAAPAWVTQVGRSTPLNISSQVATLDTQLETLRQEQVLHEEQATELKEKLHQIEREATGSDPVKTWEALDHIQSQVQDAADQAAQEAASQSQKINQAQMLTEALAKHGDMLSPQQLSQAMQALQDMAKQAAAENERFREAMKKQGLDPETMANQQELTPEQLEALNQAMQMTREELKELLENLQKAGLGQNPQAGQPGQQGQQGQQQPNGSAGRPGAQLSPEQVAQMLSEMMEGRSVEEILQAIDQLQQMQAQMQQGQGQGGQGEGTGSGGIGRGGGPTDMTWKDDPTSDENTAFKDKTLPPAELQALQQSQRVGLGTGSPEVDTEASGSTGGVLRDQNAQGSAARQTVLPRHRAAVRDYFQRESQGQPAAGND